jgi:predicted RNase H-like HicB family nuclease
MSRANCLENNIASQGKTIGESIENLKEAIVLFEQRLQRHIERLVRRKS